MREEPEGHPRDHRTRHPPDLLEELLSGQAVYDSTWRARSQESAEQGEYPIDVCVPGLGGQGVVTVRCALKVKETAANSRVLGHLLAGGVTATAVEAAIARVTCRLIPEPQAPVTMTISHTIHGVKPADVP